MIAVDPVLFSSLDPPRLAGSCCASCGTVSFPAQAGCAKCTGTDLARIELADRGTLWTWTIQAFEPKAPYRVPAGGFTPYGVGYVELAALASGAAAVLVESRLTIADPGQLHIGGEMELVIVPFRQHADGSELVTFAFRPASRTT